MSSGRLFAIPLLIVAFLLLLLTPLTTGHYSGPAPAWHVAAVGGVTLLAILTAVLGSPGPMRTMRNYWIAGAVLYAAVFAFARAYFG